MLINPIVANLHNTKTDRFHPILFDERPVSGFNPNPLVVIGDKPLAVAMRHKSVGHHTEGFDTREEAIAYCQTSNNFGCCVRLCIAKDFPWDGEGIPAMVVFFVEIDGQLHPAF